MMQPQAHRSIESLCRIAGVSRAGFIAIGRSTSRASKRRKCGPECSRSCWRIGAITDIVASPGSYASKAGW